ncbi:hypothetical protein ACWIG5_34505 [Streptomyces lydicus]
MTDRECDATPVCCLAALPVDFTALCELRYGLFLSFTRLHLEAPGHAEDTVRAALGDLAITWTQVLQRPCVAEAAWTALRHRITAETQHLRGQGRGGTLLGLVYRALPEVQADAVALRYLMKLSLGEAADLVGADPAAIAYRVRAAQRQLGEDLEHRLRPAGPASAAGSEARLAEHVHDMTVS